MMDALDHEDDGAKIAKQHDELLKRIFKEHFVEFLRFIYPDADAIFDFSKGVVFMDKELLKIIPDRERKAGGRIADLLVKVYLLDGSERWILVHTEIEGGSDINFSFRMFQYNYRIIDRYKVHVESIAFFTGDRSQPRPDQYLSQGIMTSYDFRYKTYHIFDHSEAELLAMDNIFAYIVLACQKAFLEGKVPIDELAQGRSLIFRTLFETRKYSKEQITEFIFFLKSIIFIGSKEIDLEFDSYIYEITGGIIDMGVLEIVEKKELERIYLKGQSEARKEERARAEAEKRSIVRNLINQTAFSDAEIAGIAEVAETLVTEVRAELDK